VSKGVGQSRHDAAMARKLRVEYEGAIYHVMNRGDRQEPIFRDDQDQALTKGHSGRFSLFTLLPIERTVVNK
jgi:hypothetical protein